MRLKLTNIEIEMNRAEINDVYCLIDTSLENYSSEERKKLLDQYPLGKELYLKLKYIISKNNE